MKLPAVPVTSFPDATLNAEAVQGVLTSPSKQPLAFLQLLTSGLVQIATGNTLFNGAAASSITGISVTTGIGRTIAAFIAISAAGPSSDWFLGGWANGSPAGTVTINAYRPFGNFTAGTNNYSFNWVAIG